MDLYYTDAAQYDLISADQDLDDPDHDLCDGCIAFATFPLYGVIK